MHKILFKKNIVFIVILLITGSIVSEARTLKVGYIEFPPVFYTNDKGNPEGILIDLASKIIPEAGYEWQAFSYPVKRMAGYIVSGKLDLWIGLNTIPVFENNAYKSSIKVHEITLKVYRTDKRLPDIKNPEDLKNKSVIILSGYSYGGWINFINNRINSVKYTKAHNHDSALKMLKAGRADYLLNYNRPAEKAIKKSSEENIYSNTVSSFGAYFVVSKKVPDAENILKNLEAAYLKLKREKKL